MKVTRTSVVMPAYNEESRIGAVLRVLTTTPQIDEVIVVDDGSQDLTSAVVARFAGVRLLRNERNAGKHAALLQGVEQSRGEILLLVDADVSGLTLDGINALIDPVRRDRCAMTIAYRGGTSIWDKFCVWTEPWLCGERCLRRDRFLAVEGIQNISGYETEVLLNRHFLARRERIEIVPIETLAQCPKVQKLGFLQGARGDLRMLLALLYRVGLLELMRQAFSISLRFQLSRLVRSSRAKLP